LIPKHVGFNEPDCINIIECRHTTANSNTRRETKCRFNIKNKPVPFHVFSFVQESFEVLHQAQTVLTGQDTGC
jgi:hypothetical protein